MLQNLRKGVDIIAASVSAMPARPGVYQMLDKKKGVLYIGKAKKLPQRVINYTHPERLPYRLQAMVAQTCAVEYMVTQTEAEALLLEASLIKKLKPRYNILLMDDKSYPYIFIACDHDFPRISKHRGDKKQGGDYFGPYVSAGAVDKAIRDLQKAFLIRPCQDSFFNHRKRPCIEYQIKRCSAPCVGLIDKGDYAKLVKQTKDFLKGKSRDIQKELVAAMEEESEKQHYEKAAQYRDRIRALHHIQARQFVISDKFSDADIIGICRQGWHYCVQVVFFRGGQNLGQQAFFPKHTESSSTEDVLSSFIGQFYQQSIPPAEVILSHTVIDLPLIKELVSLLAGHAVKLIVPQRGYKKELVEQVVNHAKIALEQQRIEMMKQDEYLEAVQRCFQLHCKPERIEIYDNSHIMGHQAIGAMVVAGKAGFLKKEYRQFNIKDHVQGKGDDYAMLEQVLMRRLTRLKKEHPSYVMTQWPDLLLIDGGAGHLSVAQKVLDALQLQSIPVVCMAKGPHRNAGRETFYCSRRNPFLLPKNDPVLYYLQLLRDEAHHYAIGSHRRRRSHDTMKSGLDTIVGIGPKRKKALLTHFGSLAAIQAASVEELIQVEGIHRKVAETILQSITGK